jgi:hypothetical protein
MGYQDKSLTCSDCRHPFVFSAEEQGLSGELGYEQPKRCRGCGRARERARRDVGGLARGGDVVGHAI